MLVPKSESDLVGCQELVSASDPEIASEVVNLLRLLKNPLSPVFEPISQRVARIGSALVEPVRAVLRGDDSSWKYALLYGLLPLVDSQIIRALYCDLENIAKMPTPLEEQEEVDILATKLIKNLSR